MSTKEDLETIKYRLDSIELERDELVYLQVALAELGHAKLAAQVHFLSRQARQELFALDMHRLHTETERLRHNLKAMRDEAKGHLTEEAEEDGAEEHQLNLRTSGAEDNDG